MAAVMDKKGIVKGGSFLIEDRLPSEIFTPEDFNEEHRMIGDTTRQFMDARPLGLPDKTSPPNPLPCEGRGLLLPLPW